MPHLSSSRLRPVSNITDLIRTRKKSHGYSIFFIKWNLEKLVQKVGIKQAKEQSHSILPLGFHSIPILHTASPTDPQPHLVDIGTHTHFFIFVNPLNQTGICPFFCIRIPSNKAGFPLSARVRVRNVRVNCILIKRSCRAVCGLRVRICLQPEWCDAPVDYGNVGMGSTVDNLIHCIVWTIVVPIEFILYLVGCTSTVVTHPSIAYICLNRFVLRE